MVQNSQDQEYQRNRRHLLKVQEQKEVIKENPVVGESPVTAEESSSTARTWEEEYTKVLVTRSGRISKPNPKYKDYCK